MQVTDISRRLAQLVEPRSMSEDSRRQEYILNVLVLGAIGLTGIALILTIVETLVSGAGGISDVIMTLLLGVFLGLYVMSRKGRYRPASYLLILFYFVPTTYSILAWGAVPQSLLTYALIIVLSGVLIGTRIAWIMTGLIACVLVSSSLLEGFGYLAIDASWGGDDFHLSDNIVFSLTFFNILIVSWLSNREIEKSLVRARTSEQALAKERDALEERVEARTEELADLYDFAKNTSNLLQEALILMPDTLNGIEFGHSYRSATETALIGGDFYDLFELENDKLGIVMGDVSGKGVEAGALTALIKNTIKANALRDPSPSSVIAYTNQALCRVVEPHKFATVFFGILDLRLLELTYCSAGHPHVIIQSAGSVRLVDCQNSPAIGLFEDMSFVEGRLKLRSQDALILYTDGAFEAKGPTDRFGEARLLETLAGSQANPVTELPLIVQEAVAEFTGQSLADDLAVLAIALD